MAKKSWLERKRKGPKFEVRRHNRCSICGRARAYIRKFGVCRICFRAMAHRGELPGVSKSSW
ncbi:MAG: type Z 30S ribosomal protein S14 [Candidatus Margulisiibacteriota bacterium]